MIGYTPQLAIGVWVGNNDNTAMANGGSIMAGPIFTKAMGSILSGVDTSFPSVSGVVQKNICRSNFGIANNVVKGQTYTEWFLETALPQMKCSAAETPSPTPTPTPSQAPSEEVNELTLTLSASPANSASQGTNVAFTAILSDATATGIVRFQSDGQTFGVSAVIAGSATMITPLLPVGQHTITATFTPFDTSKYDSAEDSISYKITSSNSNRN